MSKIKLEVKQEPALLDRFQAAETTQVQKEASPSVPARAANKIPVKAEPAASISVRSNKRQGRPAKRQKLAAGTSQVHFDTSNECR